MPLEHRGGRRPTIVRTSASIGALARACKTVEPGALLRQGGPDAYINPHFDSLSLRGDRRGRLTNLVSSPPYCRCATGCWFSLSFGTGGGGARGLRVCAVSWQGGHATAA